MSQLNPSEISSVLKEKIAGLDLSAERKNEGIIVSVSDGIVEYMAWAMLCTVRLLNLKTAQKAWR